MLLVSLENQNSCFCNLFNFFDTDRFIFNNLDTFYMLITLFLHKPILRRLLPSNVPIPFYKIGIIPLLVLLHEILSFFLNKTL